MDSQGSGTGRGPLGGIIDEDADVDPTWVYRWARIDEIVLRTACGCEKIVRIGSPTRYFSTNFVVESWAKKPMSLDADPVMSVRRDFIHYGKTDHQGRWILEEDTRELNEVWAKRYRELHQQVYGMDSGL